MKTAACRGACAGVVIQPAAAVAASTDGQDRNWCSPFVLLFDAAKDGAEGTEGEAPWGGGHGPVARRGCHPEEPQVGFCVELLDCVALGFELRRLPEQRGQRAELQGTAGCPVERPVQCQPRGRAA